MNETDLLHELAPEAERLLERHLSVSKEWFPHQLVPWERAAKYDPRSPWDIEAHPMDEAVRQALFLNLLTEDNLPYYTSKIDDMFGIDDPWGAWNRRWTAEEG
ncbi:MAG: acyl-[acyl-carrier-protein] desaturase, partial [Actinomycetota bacterium]|nr:acyl-[acyl-carrier-protein] desaturase [Actinomycetota bacterium]